MVPLCYCVVLYQIILLWTDELVSAPFFLPRISKERGERGNEYNIEGERLREEDPQV